MITREQVMSALFALTAPLETSGVLKRRSRIALTWDNVSPEEQPALYQIETSETAQAQKGLPTIYTLGVEWYVYVNGTNDPSVIHSTALNNILDSLEAIIAPVPGTDTQTLGGLVSRVSPASREIYEGTLGNQAVGVLHFSIVYLPNFAGAACV